MSRKNVEAFERGIDAYNRQDVEAFLADLDPDVEWRTQVDVEDGKVIRVRAYLDPEEALEAAGLSE